MTRNQPNGSSNKPAHANSQKEDELSCVQRLIIFGGRTAALAFLGTLSIMALSGHDWQLGLQLQAKQWDAGLKIDLKSQGNR